MSTWAVDTLSRIASSDDFHVAPFREDGATPGTAIWVWSAVVDDHVFERSSKAGSRWFAAAVNTGGGLVSSARYSGGVIFELVVDETMKDRVDQAFKAKYETDPFYLDSMLENSRHQIAQVSPRSQ